MFARDWKAVAERLTADTVADSPMLRVSDPAVKRALGVDAVTVVRWIVSGKRGVYLDGVQAGGRSWSTTLAAAARFLEQLTARTSRPSPLPEVLPMRSGSLSRPGDAIRALRQAG